MIEIIVKFVTPMGKEYTSEPMKVEHWEEAVKQAIWTAMWHRDPTVIIKGIERTDI